MAAMAAVSTCSSSALVDHSWTRRQLKKGFWSGKNGRCCSVVAFDYFSWGYVALRGGGGLGGGSSSPRRFIVLGKADSKISSCSCSRGFVGRGFRVVQQGRGGRRWRCVGSNGGGTGGEGEEDEEKKKLDENNTRNGDDEEVDQALKLDGEIPTSSVGFLKQVSSDAYDLRRQLEQNIEASSYDVLEANPWRETPKPVYVLAQEENRLLTMRTRRARSEVERELGMLFPKRGSRRGRQGRPSSTKSLDESAQPAPVPSGSDAGFRMLVEDIREGVLVFEDEEEAAAYCSLLDGHGKSCAGVAELDASDVFAVCQKTHRLAVLFRRGTTPPQPDRLQSNLKARRRSLEDQS